MVFDLVKKDKKFYVLCLLIIFFILSFRNYVFSAPYTLCPGPEFNRRVKLFLNGNDRNALIDNTITRFERGYNPPIDPEYYVDVSEDLDESVIVYTVNRDINNPNRNDNVLYWYSDYIVSMNQNSAYMFDKFVSIRTIDLTDFTYLNGLADTRYMFLDCRSLRNLKLTNGYRPFTLVEIQGMFYNCQSLTNVDLTLFDTHLVDNMDEVFCKCYNLRNIYVNKSIWNTESVRSFKRMFTECHALRTNDGKKAVDINEDDYEKYAVIGSDNKEGLIKDINTTYEDYGEYIDTIPVDGAYYIKNIPETTQAYAEEPEYDVENGDNINAYVGDKSTGYYAEKEQQISKGIIMPSSEVNIIGQTETSMYLYNDATDANVEMAKPADNELKETIELDEIETFIIETESNNIKDIEVEENVVIETSAIKETEGIVTDDINEKRILELDDYLREQGDNGKENDIVDIIFENYKFLVLALAISIIVILLLVGMVVYLTNSNRENKDDESHNL